MNAYTGTQPPQDDESDGPQNPYATQPIMPPPTPAELGVEELTETECWALIATSRLGRIAVATDGRPDLLPVNFHVHERSLYVRSAPGGKLRHMAEAPAVSFEIDGTDERFHWSVVVSADAQRLDADDDIEAAGIVEFVSWSPTDKNDFVRLTPVAVSGRRFPRAHHVRDAAARRPIEHVPIQTGSSGGQSVGVPEPHDTKPNPIPSFSPRGR